ncbi:MAG: hypothetical protein ACRCW2_14260 [Cellulosilyticaceae bacterium]
MNKDIGNYRANINFIVEVFPKVYWVPVCSLGGTRYTNQEIRKLVTLSPEDKYKQIANLYEALQLFITSEFKGVLDNQTHIISQDEEQWEIWQTHTSGKDALRSNQGCCATDTNWLAYLLKDKYEDIGAFGYSIEDGNGHVTSYIKHKGWYYFIDFMLCRPDSLEYCCIENGSKEELLSKEWGGSLFKCKEPIDFVKFTLERCSSKKREVPIVFHMRRCNEVTASGAKRTSEGITFLVPKRDNPEVLYINQNANVEVQLVDQINLF